MTGVIVTVGLVGRDQSPPYHISTVCVIAKTFQNVQRILRLLIDLGLSVVVFSVENPQHGRVAEIETCATPNITEPSVVCIQDDIIR